MLTQRSKMVDGLLHIRVRVHDTMNSLFTTQSFLVDGSDKIACVIAGYRGKIASYQSVIKVLNERGYSVVAYEHNPTVLSGGRPQDLLDLVDGIDDDFRKQADGCQTVICLGASLGAGICFELQRRMPSIKFGVYAGAGISPPESIFSAPLFYLVRKKFKRNGVDATKLKSLWKSIDISADDPPRKDMHFMMVLGKQDKIITYKKANATFKAWQAAGVPVTIIVKRNLGHSGVIRWYKKHTSELLDQAEKSTTEQYIDIN